MKRKLYFALFLLNYLIGIACVGESILYSFFSLLHLPTGIIIRLSGLIIETILLYSIFIKRSELTFKMYGICKLFIGVFLIAFLCFTDKAIDVFNRSVFAGYAVSSLFAGLVCLIKTPNQVFASESGKYIA